MTKKQYYIVLFLFGAVLISGMIIPPLGYNTQGSRLHKRTLKRDSSLLATSENNYTMDYSYVIAHEYVDYGYGIISGFMYISDHNFYVVGGIQQSSGSAYSDLFVQKIDENGNIVWNFTYSGSGGFDDIAYDAWFGNDGNYIYVTGTTQPSDGDYDLLLLKLNKTDGTLIWAKTWGNSRYYDYGKAVYTDGRFKTGYGIYVAGYTREIGPDKTGDIILLKFDVNGNLVWSKYYDGGNDDYAEDVHAGLSDGGILVAGATSNGSYYQGILLRYDYDGTLLDESIFSSNCGSRIFHGFSMPLTIPDYFYVIEERPEANGKTYAHVLKISNDTLTYTPSDDLVFPDSSVESVPTDIVEDYNYLYITGYVVNGGTKDEFLWKVDKSDLSSVSHEIYDSGREDEAHGVAYSPNFIITAGTQVYGETLTKKAYYWNVWSSDKDDDGLSNFNEIKQGTNLANPDTDNDGLQDGAEVYTYLTNPLNNDTDADNITDGTEVNVYYTNPLSNDTDADNITDYAEIFTYKTNATNPDTDGDGLTDYAEIFTYKTNATNPDTDGDGMPDGWEIQYELNATNAADANNDNDNDGLMNLDEFKNGTDPTNPDTDGDGMPDGWEVAYTLDPNNSSDATEDPDNDTLTNIQEFQHKTNPLSNDTDNDGMPDNWEIQYGLNATNPNDANEDKDNDGLTNLQEYQDGTDPTVDNVPPTIKAVWTMPNPPNNATEIVIYANVEDTNGISSVRLTYYVDGVGHNVTMSLNSTSGYFYYNLGILSVDTNVTYFITTTDNAGNIRISATYSFIVVGASGTEGTTPGAGSSEGSTPLGIMGSIPILVGGIAAIAVVIVVVMMKKKK